MFVIVEKSESVEDTICIDHVYHLVKPDVPFVKYYRALLILNFYGLGQIYFSDALNVRHC